MASLAVTAHSVFSPSPITRPRGHSGSLPDIVHRILPHAHYSSFLEILTTGPHGLEAPVGITPSLPFQGKNVSNDLATHTRCLHEEVGIPDRELQVPPSHHDDLVFCTLYKTHGKFAWMNGRAIEDVKVLKWLGEGVMSSAHIQSGTVRTPRQDGWDSTTVNYVCKTWDMSRMGEWDGFYSELALYKSSRYLLPLQGDVVPHVMGVYTRPGQVDIAMALPHPVLWIEASASMPMVLKDRVVEAFQRLHERGVVHGDVALRHILIDPDARVTLIDFQASRADQPNEDLGLAATYPGDKDLEMRRVRFLLNMDNARRQEFRKSREAHQRSARNRARAQRRHETLRHGITTGLPLDEPEPLEDIKEPPIPLDELEKYWMEDANDDPRRFVVPGTSDSKVTEAITSFLRSIRSLEKADCGWSVIVNASSSPRSPLNSPIMSPHHTNVLELPPSIKVRDFAYETACWSSTPSRQAGHDTAIHGSPTRSSPGKLKRGHEEERLPASKRARLDSCSEKGSAIRKVAKTSNSG